MLNLMNFEISKCIWSLRKIHTKQNIKWLTLINYINYDDHRLFFILITRYMILLVGSLDSRGYRLRHPSQRPEPPTHHPWRHGEELGAGHCRSRKVKWSYIWSYVRFYWRLKFASCMELWCTSICSSVRVEKHINLPVELNWSWLIILHFWMVTLTYLKSSLCICIKSVFVQQPNSYGTNPCKCCVQALVPPVFGNLRVVAWLTSKWDWNWSEMRYVCL